MCGILGFVGRDGEPIDRAGLLAANERMRARGPDDHGEFFEGNVGLAMRRLAVIDLAGGRQPQVARNGEVVAFQNGEIYNHRELRAELEARGCRFATHSDTEVLAQGFAAWGMDELLRRLDGMFALAILDRRERALWLARDRFGEKPLFCTGFTRSDAGLGSGPAGCFAFASSLHALQALARFRGAGAGDFEIDPRALDDYLALHFVPGRRTIFQGVWRLLPGERLRFDLPTRAVDRQRWWQLPLPRPREVADDELLARLDAAVRSRLVADVPVGVFLSGGLDSSLVAALAARAKGGIDTFSMGFAATGLEHDAAGASDHDESPFAALVARHIGSSHHHFQFDATSFRTLLPQVAAALDEPVGDPAQLPLFWLCREARRTATVVLSGEGADELFGGYDYYARFAPAVGWRERFARWRRRRRRSSRIAPADAAASRLIDHDGTTLPSGYPLVFDRALRRRLLPDLPAVEPEEFERDVLARLATATSALQRATAADLLTWLPDDLLVKFDRMAMAHGLEGRAPYLQPELAELALALPPARRATFQRRKVALTAAARPLLPAAILARRKHGFVLPMRTWLADYFAAQGGLDGWMRERPLPRVDGRALRDCVGEELAAVPMAPGSRRTRALFSLVLLGEWWAAHRAAAAR